MGKEVLEAGFVVDVVGIVLYNTYLHKIIIKLRYTLVAYTPYVRTYVRICIISICCLVGIRYLSMNSHVCMNVSVCIIQCLSRRV